MIETTIDEQQGIVTLEPTGALGPEDFASVGRIVDPYIEADGQLNGLVIQTERFPGWDSLAGLASHIRFVRSHHDKIRRVALVTDSLIGGAAEVIGAHFVGAEVRAFTYAEQQSARLWVRGGEIG